MRGNTSLTTNVLYSFPTMTVSRNNELHFTRCFSHEVNTRLPHLRNRLHVLPQAVGAYETIQEIESAKLVYEMLVRTKDSTRNCQRYAASLVFHLSYGRRLADDDHDLVAIQEILDNFVRDTYPGAHLVDTLPVLDYLPDILAPWRALARKRHAAETKASVSALECGNTSSPRCCSSTSASRCRSSRRWSRATAASSALLHVCGSNRPSSAWTSRSSHTVDVSLRSDLPLSDYSTQSRDRPSKPAPTRRRGQCSGS